MTNSSWLTLRKCLTPSEVCCERPRFVIHLDWRWNSSASYSSTVPLLRLSHSEVERGTVAASRAGKCMCVPFSLGCDTLRPLWEDVLMLPKLPVSTRQLLPAMSSRPARKLRYSAVLHIIACSYTHTHTHTHTTTLWEWTQYFRLQVSDFCIQFALNCISNANVKVNNTLNCSKDGAR